MREEDFIALVVMLVIGVIALTVYVGLILLGVRIAQRKNRSPHWMWFAVHPIGLLITVIVLACLPPLKHCPNCGQRSAATANLCGFCGYSFIAAQGYMPPQPPMAYIPPRGY